MNGKRWLVLAVVFFGILVSYIDRGNLSVANETIARTLALDPATMGLLLSAFFWTYAIFQIPAGALVDRFGVRGTYAVAFVVWSLASASIALAHSQRDILASRLLLGMAETVGPVASLAAIRASFREGENGLPTAVYIAGQAFGPSLSLLAGSALIVSVGWRAMFAVTGLAALVWVPAWLMVAPRVETKTRQAFDWRPLAAEPVLWGMAAFILLVSYYWYFVLTWVPAYLTASRGFSTLGMGRIFSAALASMAIVSMSVGFVADRLVKKSESLFGARAWIVAVGSVGAASLTLLNALSGNALAMSVMFISVCSFGVVSSNFWTLAQNVAPRDKVARVVAVLNTASQIGGITAPWITGKLIGPHKNFAPAIAIAGVCPLVSLLPWWIASRGMERLRESLQHTAEEPRTAL